MPIESPAAYAPSLHDDHDAPYREPLSVWKRRLLLASVIFFHVGAGYALTQIEPTRIVVGDAPPMEVRMVSEEQPASGKKRGRRSTSSTNPASRFSKRWWTERTACWTTSCRETS